MLYTVWVIFLTGIQIQVNCKEYVLSKAIQTKKKEKKKNQWLVRLLKWWVTPQVLHIKVSFYKSVWSIPLTCLYAEYEASQQVIILA